MDTTAALTVRRVSDRLDQIADVLAAPGATLNDRADAGELRRLARELDHARAAMAHAVAALTTDRIADAIRGVPVGCGHGDHVNVMYAHAVATGPGDRARTLIADVVDQEDGLRTCDTCDRVTDAGEYPDWTNGRCEDCDPSVLETVEV